MIQKFTIGQCVEYTATGIGPGRYTILRMMPVEGHHTEPMYRIKGERAGEERVVTECNLSENVGAPADYPAPQGRR